MYELDIPIWAVKDKTILVNVHISFPLPGTSELRTCQCWRSIWFLKWTVQFYNELLLFPSLRNENIFNVKTTLEINSFQNTYSKVIMKGERKYSQLVGKLKYCRQNRGQNRRESDSEAGIYCFILRNPSHSRLIHTDWYCTLNKMRILHITQNLLMCLFVFISHDEWRRILWWILSIMWCWIYYNISDVL